MSRLTIRTEDLRAIIRLYTDPEYVKGLIDEAARRNREVVEKLARYEDLNEPDPETGLKPCPLCGGKAIMQSFITAGEKEPRLRIKCAECWCMTNWDNFSEKQAIAAWNRRAGETDDSK